MNNAYGRFLRRLRYLLHALLRLWRPLRSTALWYRLVLLVPFFIILPHVLGMVDYGLITRIEQRLYDWRLNRFDMNSPYDARIVIIDIDNASLRRYGRWPWRRTVLTQLSTELLQRQQVAVLGFDILFAEADDSDYMALQAQAQTQANGVQGVDVSPLRDTASSDWALAQSLRQQPAVLGYYFSSTEEGGQTGLLPASLAITANQRGVYEGLPAIESYSANLPVLVQAAPYGGFMNALIDSDGELRRIPLIAQQGKGAVAQYYPALSLAMFTTLLGQPEIQLLDARGQALQQAANKPAHVGALVHARLAALGVRQGDDVLSIPTDSHGAMLVPFRSQGGREGGHFRYISAADVLDGKLPAGSLQGRAVIVGTSVPGLRDLRVTPVSNYFPGVEVHAVALAAMLDGAFIHAPDYGGAYATLVLLITLLTLLLILPRRGAAGALTSCLLLIGLMASINLWAYVQARVVLPVVAGVIMVLMAYVLHISYGFFLEARTKKQLVQLFGHYIPAELVDEMAKHPGGYSLQAQARELTIMFCDVQQFTRMAESMEPAQVQDLLNRLFNRIAAVMAPNNGTIDKYIGDCVMAFWGAPLPVENHAWLAVKTACEITHMLADFNAEQTGLNQPIIRMGIGINTGVVRVGDMGSSIRKSYTVLGDAVNLAARLEPLARKYGCPVVAGPRTVECTQQVPWQWLDRIRVAGKAQAVDVYAPLDAVLSTQDLSDQQWQELDAWQQFRAAYQRFDWDASRKHLATAQALRPDKPLYAVYSQRLHAFMQSPPPPDWDGVIDIAK